TFTLTSIGKLNKGDKIYVTFNDLLKTSSLYNNSINISNANKEASVLTISLVDPTPKKAEDIINKLIEVYNKEAIADKNQIAQNTVRFIDDRLAYLVTELEGVEKSVESYKKENQ